MSGRPDFDVRSYRLRELRAECWEGFVFVSLDPDAASIAERLGKLSEQIFDYRMADYVPVYTTEETWDTNWKCLVENYMDAYHVHRVHRNSFARHGSSEDRTELHDGNDACTYHYVTEDDGPKAVRPHPHNTWIRQSNRHRTWLINIFPSHTMQLQPDMLWYLSILPEGGSRVRIRWSLSLPPEHVAAAHDREALASEWLGLLERVNSEDRPVVENVFRATRSPHAAQGPLSHLERNVWHFGRYLARRLCD